MFADGDWQDVDSQENRYNDWCRSVCALAKQRSSAEKPLRVTILEIGAGNNVTTVRSTSESRLRNFLDSGADARLVRVNPDFPLGDLEDYAPGGRSNDRVISLMGRGLDCIRRIQAAMDAAKNPVAASPPSQVAMEAAKDPAESSPEPKVALEEE